MHSNSIGTTGFLEKTKMFILSLHYQLPFSQIGRYPSKMNWTVAQHAFCVQPEQNPLHPRGEIFDYASIFHEKSFNFQMGFKLQEQWINSQDPAAIQSNSSCLETDLFGE